MRGHVEDERAAPLAHDQLEGWLVTEWRNWLVVVAHDSLLEPDDSGTLS